MTPTELAAKLARGRACLLDVREHWEWQTAQVEPSVHMPMATIPERLDELRAVATDRELVVICHTGARSQRVAEFLNQAGFDGVFNLEGGIDAWSREVDSSVPRY